MVWGMIGRDVGGYEFVDAQAVVVGLKAIKVRCYRRPRRQERLLDATVLGLSATGNFFMDCRNPANFLGYCECHVACGPGIRCGVNLFAIPEFVLGLFGIDLAGDDSAMKELKEKSKHTSERPPSPCGWVAWTVNVNVQETTMNRITILALACFVVTGCLQTSTDDTIRDLGDRHEDVDVHKS